MKGLYILLVGGMVAAGTPLASAQDQSKGAAETVSPAEQPAAESPTSWNTPPVPAAASPESPVPAHSSATPPAGSDAATNSEAAPAAQGDEQKAVEVDIVALQAAGYKIINENGTKLYCKREAITGSRLQFRTRCFTYAELIRSQNNTAEMLSEMSRKAPIPRGN